MTPGRLRLRALPTDGPGGGGAVLLIDGTVNMRNANWVTRRLAARDPLAEPAMTATAAFVLLRALALEASREPTSAPGSVGDPPGRWPRTAMRAPPLERLAGGDLARRVAAAELATGPATDRAVGLALAVVRSRADGRLAAVEIALGSPLPVAVVETRLGDVARWQALPGWKSVAARARGPGAPPLWEVDSSFPFVDFDAQWTVRSARPFRASADGGDWRGPVMGWDVAAGAGAASSQAMATVAAFSLHPRLELTGYLPRKLIEAEPLLEHGLALGLAYVNAVSLLRRLQR
jgi:hypothetical protein